MNKQNIDMLERIREVDDNEIREFISSEKDRLGVILQGFTVTWFETEQEYQLILSSDGTRTKVEGHPWPFERGFTIGRIPKSVNGQHTFNVIKCAGRAFYYLWRKEIWNLKRDLGGQSS